MFYVIRDCGVDFANTLPLLNKKLNAKLEQSEFNVVGKDFVVYLNDQDLDFVQDKHKMENILFSNFFRKDNSVKFMLLFNLIFIFILMIMVGNI